MNNINYKIIFYILLSILILICLITFLTDNFLIKVLFTIFMLILGFLIIIYQIKYGSDKNGKIGKKRTK